MHRAAHWHRASLRCTSAVRMQHPPPTRTTTCQKAIWQGAGLCARLDGRPGGAVQVVAHALRLGAPAAACARRPPIRVARRASVVHNRLHGSCLHLGLITDKARV